MTTTTETPAPTCEKVRKPRPKPLRSARYHRINAVYGTLEMTITTGSKVETVGYHIETIPSDFGRGFNVRKYATQVKEGEPSSYDVLLDLEPEDAEHPRHSCECWGWTRHGHCRHVEALLALVHAGKL